VADAYQVVTSKRKFRWAILILLDHHRYAVFDTGVGQHGQFCAAYSQQIVSEGDGGGYCRAAPNFSRGQHSTARHANWDAEALRDMPTLSIKALWPFVTWVCWCCALLLGGAAAGRFEPYGVFRGIWLLHLGVTALAAPTGCNWARARRGCA